MVVPAETAVPAEQAETAPAGAQARPTYARSSDAALGEAVTVARVAVVEVEVAALEVRVVEGAEGHPSASCSEQVSGLSSATTTLPRASEATAA